MAEIIYGTDFKGLSESRLPPKEVGSVVAWPIVPAVDTAPSEIVFMSGLLRRVTGLSAFIAPDGDCA
jgi:hypothetical protein